MVRILMLLAALAPWAAVAADARPDLRRVEQLVVQGTNGFRQQRGLGTLSRQDKLDAAAREFARYMASNNHLSHEADGRKPQERIADQGYRYCRMAENISYQYSTAGFGTEELASRLVEGWKNSPGHRRNMLEAGAVHTGVAVARSSTTGHYYAVQLFASPRLAGGRC